MTHPVDYPSGYFLPYEKVVARFEDFENLLISNDIRLNGRFMNYKRTIMQYKDEVARKKQKSLHDAELIIQAVYEIDKITAITNALRSQPEMPEWKQHLKRLLADSNFPEKDIKDNPSTPGRDKQFELLTAAIFKQAGFPVRLDEPDVIVSHPDMEFGIAAKRIKSEKQIEKHISKAGKQIIQQGMDGIISLDLSFLYHPPLNPFLMVTLAPEDAVLELHNYTKTFIQKNSQEFSKIVNNSKVFGLMVFVSKIYLSLQTGQFGVASCFKATNLCSTSDPRFDFINKLVGELAQNRL